MAASSRNFYMAIVLPLCILAKLPADRKTNHVSHDCWAPDYCDPERFQYKLCKLRLRGRKAAVATEYACPEGEYCEELECDNKCWLPSYCWCEDKGNATQPDHSSFTAKKALSRHEYHGRMFCEDGGCFKHPSTQWGICRPELSDEEHAEMDDADDESVMPTGFHFWTPDECALLIHSS